MNTNDRLAKKNRHNTIRRIVKLRTKDLLSWQDIAAMLEIAPRTARRLFQEAKGEHQHHDHLPGKGGRFPAGQYNADTQETIVWLPDLEDGVAPVLPGDGSVNPWYKVTA